MKLAIEDVDYDVSSNNEFNDRRFGLLLSGTSKQTICVPQTSWPEYNMVTRSRGRGGLSIAKLYAEIEAVLPDGSTIHPRKNTRSALTFLGNQEQYNNSMIRLKEGATLTVAIPYEYFDGSDELLKQVVDLNYQAELYICD
jgi:hypothetical protein